MSKGHTPYHLLLLTWNVDWPCFKFLLFAVQKKRSNKKTRLLPLPPSPRRPFDSLSKRRLLALRCSSAPKQRRPNQTKLKNHETPQPIFGTIPQVKHIASIGLFEPAQRFPNQRVPLSGTEARCTLSSIQNAFSTAKLSMAKWGKRIGRNPVPKHLSSCLQRCVTQWPSWPTNTGQPAEPTQKPTG